MPLDTETITKIQAGIPKLGPFDTSDEAYGVRGDIPEKDRGVVWVTQDADYKWWLNYLPGGSTTLLEPLEQE